MRLYTRKSPTPLDLFKETRVKSKKLLGQSVPNSTTAIIEFERLLTDMQANLTMVKTDQLHAQSLIQTLQGKDFIPATE